MSQAEREELIHGRTHKQLQADACANADSVLECARELQLAMADQAVLFAALAELRQITKLSIPHGTGTSEPNWQTLRVPNSGPTRDRMLKILERTDALLKRLKGNDPEELAEGEKTDKEGK